MANLASVWKTKCCGQTVLPDRSILIGQKLVENAKIEQFQCDILGDIQTLCISTYPKVHILSKNQCENSKILPIGQKLEFWLSVDIKSLL